jgi:hypothetical protein
LGGDSESIQSPGTAKNVITVGALEQPRNITNEVWKCIFDPTNGASCTTNTPWQTETDSGDQVAAFSSRGNVGITTEGDFGRFKPDLVAPGTFVVSTRSTQFDQGAYYNPTNYHYQTFSDVADTNTVNPYIALIPGNAVQWLIHAWTADPTFNLPIYVRQSDTPRPQDLLGTNSVSLPPDKPLNPVGTFWFYGIGNPSTNEPVSFTIQSTVVTTNDDGNKLEVLSNMNNTLGPFYRYESGTSQATTPSAPFIATNRAPARPPPGSQARWPSCRNSFSALAAQIVRLS